MDIFSYTFKVIVAPELQQALLPFKIVVFIFSFIALGLIIYWFFTTSYKDYLFLDRWRDWEHWRDDRRKKIERFKQRKREEKVMFRQDKEEQVSEEGQNKKYSEEKNEGENTDKSKLVKEQRMGDWERILEKLKSKNELNYKLAFIDADKIFNEVLRERQIKLSPKTVPNSEAIVKAKEVLEKMLSRPEAKLTLERAKELVSVYKKALSELKVI